MAYGICVWAHVYGVSSPPLKQRVARHPPSLISLQLKPPLRSSPALKPISINSPAAYLGQGQGQDQDQG